MGEAEIILMLCCMGVKTKGGTAALYHKTQEIAIVSSRSGSYSDCSAGALRGIFRSIRISASAFRSSRPVSSMRI